MRAYDELQGARGRAIFYRAERYRARDLFRAAVPELAIEQVNHTLDDLSLTGLGASAGVGSNEVCAVGERVSVALGLKGIPLFEGLGEIARVDPTPLGTKIGLRLVNHGFTIPQLVSKYEAAIARLTLEEQSQADHAIAPEYRRLSADVLHFLRRYRATLGRFVATKPGDAAMAEMLAACEERFLPRWREFWHAGNHLVSPIMQDDAARRATKQFTELVLTPEFMSGPIWRRSYEKPLGYPGDFQIMNMVYDWRREGEQLFDQMLHRIGLDVAECIATRMVLMRQAIAAAVLRASDGATARIASLGCGSAREVVDYLRLPQLPRAAHFTLIDQDGAALSQAYEGAHPEILRLHRQASVNCLHTSFNQLLKAGELFGRLPPQDLIYSVGLVDYLSSRRVKTLVASLYAQLAPGGTLIVGNMRETPESNLWPMEFICDWSVVYRDESEMRGFAQDLADAQIATSLDPTGRVCLLTVQKR
jgi:extracellular factor (EF) 3-hydroxypalmitic acid methyl ester biosynthesis protein